MANLVSDPGYPTGNPTPARIQSIDLLRGAVMILMAIDHVRVYAGIPSMSADPGIFFTRWVTHFCVPTFVFFAGTSAFLYGNKLSDNHKLARFLVTRGLMLVVLELTLIRLFWTFNLDFGKFTLAGVIWMLGWCMVLLAAFIRINAKALCVLGAAIAFLQFVFKYVPGLLPIDWQDHFAWFWEFIYPSGHYGPPGIAILYVIVPWIGVMMMGYGFGKMLIIDPAKRHKLCLWIGCSAIVLYLIIGSMVIINVGQSYKGDLPFVFRLLSQQKYPASPLYLLMTLGPVIALVPFAEKVRGWFANVLITFGRVPFFYYLLHILLIHCAALIVNLIREGSTNQGFYGTAPFTEIEPSHRWTLPVLYLVWLIVVVILYFVCRSYAAFKAAHPEKRWLKYI